MRRLRWRGANVRVVVIGVAFVLAWIGIGYRLYVVQGAEAAQFAELGFEQRVRHEAIPPKRGTIYDRDGVELAITVNGATVIADPSAVEDPAHTAELLAPTLGVDYVGLAQKLSGTGHFVYLARRVERSVADDVSAVVEDNDLAGITLVDDYARVYPAGPLAANILGLTEVDDGSGIEGVELVLDDELSGEPGSKVFERDPSGMVIPQASELIQPAVPGADVELTIDSEIQYITEQGLQKALLETQSRWGAIVVLRPRTGEILAMASAPSFDPTDRSSIEQENLKNRAVTEIFEPGSTLKTLEIAGAIEEGVVTPETIIDTPPTLEIADHSYEDSGSHPPSMSVADVLAHSSNIGAIKIQGMLGNDLHYKYLDLFGLGRPASIDFPGEASGNLPHVETWCVPCGPSAAIGYGISVTTLQMAAAYGAIANDGEWVEPYVISQIRHPDGTVDTTEPRRHRVVSSQIAVTMRRLLSRVVDLGTGTRAAVDGYSVAGKTGTTDRFDVDLQRYTDDTIASFIGMAPVEQPEIVIAVVLDGPHGQLDDGTNMKFGGASSAPAFADIAGPILNVLGVPPDRVPDEG